MPVAFRVERFKSSGSPVGMSSSPVFLWIRLWLGPLTEQVNGSVSQRKSRVFFS